MKFLWWFAFLFGGLYVLAGLMLFIAQDRVIFAPDVTRVDPWVEGISAVEIPTDDGETLVAWSAEPSIVGCPTVLFFHGNAARIDLDGGRYEALSDAGLGFLAVAYRGYSGSTGQPSEAGLHMDAEAAWAWLTNKQGVTGDDIVLHGHSMGTGVVTQLAARVDAGAAILEAPFYSIQDEFQSRISFLPMGLILRHTFRSDKFIGDVTEPLVIVHGTADTVIDASSSERLFDLANEPKQYVRIVGADHNSLVSDGLYQAAAWPLLSPLYPDCPFKGFER
ncbi:MAG: alpha/beta hydrolase [Pseudomonadota bacterium]